MTTVLLPYAAECADLEHAEPGTGSPPEPRRDNDETLGGDTRRDTPPIVEELEEGG
jgi:hypothetical protein